MAKFRAMTPENLFDEDSLTQQYSSQGHYESGGHNYEFTTHEKRVRDPKRTFSGSAVTLWDIEQLEWQVYPNELEGEE